MPQTLATRVEAIGSIYSTLKGNEGILHQAKRARQGTLSLASPSPQLKVLKYQYLQRPRSFSAPISFRDATPGRLAIGPKE